jgi:hypothetical protein
MISSNLYVFRHRSAIFSDFTDKYHKSDTQKCRTCDICVCRLPEDGTPVPKHVEVATYRDLYFIKCICWLIYRILASYFADGRATAYVKEKACSAKFLGCLLFDLI